MGIFTVGFACYDQFFFNSGYPEENSKNVATGFYESGGGPAANAAYLLGLWGEEVHHFAHVGVDLYADKVIAELDEVDVNTSFMIKTEKMITPLAAVIVNSKNGSRTVTVRKQHKPPKLQQTPATESLHPNTILIDGHEEELSEYLIKKHPDAKVVMDAGSVRESTVSLAKYTDYMVTSEPFALNFTGIKVFSKTKQLVAALTEIKKITKGEVVITLGEKGCAYMQGRQLKIIPGYVCHAIDTTGAGDIFHGAFTYGISYGWSIEKAIEFANLTAALSIEKVGVRPAIPLLSEIENSRLNRNLTNYFN